MNHSIQTLRTALATALLLSPLAVAKDPEVSPYAGAPGWQETKQERTQWFKDAKFGMFIHWGLYAPAGGYWPPSQETGRKFPQHYSEWIRTWANVSEPEYGDLTKPLFKPERGCTDEWAQLAKDAGMKYTVLTTKHHDGYTLFNAKAPYSVKNKITGSTNISPKGRDLVAEYAKSVRDQGLKVGYYYSIIDWQHPDAYMLSRKWPNAENADHDTYVEYMHSHIKQLFSDYGKSDIIWVDYSKPAHQGSTWKTKELLSYIHKKQPHVITNNRFWSGLQNAYGDYFTPEKYIPATGYPGRTFEVCHTMNESFGYSHHDQKWKSTEDVVQMLVDIVSKGGNLLLNIGPDAKGRVPAESARVLRETGKWLETNGEAIYGTDASPIEQLNFDGRCTVKKDAKGATILYFHLFSQPDDNQLDVTGIKSKISKLRLLGSKQKPVLKTGKKNIIHLPSFPADSPCTVLALHIDGELKVDRLTSLAKQKADRSITIKANQMEAKGQRITIAPGRKGGNISYWTNTKDTVTLPFVVNNPGPVQAGGTVTHAPGQYAVYLTAAVHPNAGGTLQVKLDGKEALSAEIASTGGWNKYQRSKIGEITLSKRGNNTLTLQATKVNKAGFMNLQQLELQPLKK